MKAADQSHTLHLLLHNKAGDRELWNCYVKNGTAHAELPENQGLDLQAIARIFRFGQEQPTHVYRIMAKNTFGHRVYRRSVDKESLFKRVIDKRHIKGATCGIL